MRSMTKLRRKRQAFHTSSVTLFVTSKAWGTGPSAYPGGCSEFILNSVFAISLLRAPSRFGYFQLRISSPTVEAVPVRPSGPLEKNA